MCCAVRHFSASVSPITCTITVRMASLLTQPWASAAAGRRVTQTPIVGARSDLLRYSTKCRSLNDSVQVFVWRRQRYSDYRTSCGSTPLGRELHLPAHSSTSGLNIPSRGSMAQGTHHIHGIHYCEMRQQRDMPQITSREIS
ncbi:hypothetical protein EDC04DRAFT_3131249 [Pisolithus marmoratus]|nr:hypothetical protein EDC04DRAFT_3131249 [Pisolithus marmoratus]